MCGRTSVTLEDEQIERIAETRRWVDSNYPRSYNVAPGSWTPVVRLSSDGRRTVQTMRWGLIPSYTKPCDKLDFFSMFNARSETVAESPAFRRVLPSRRCLVVVDGFYEWQHTGRKGPGGTGKVPFYVHLRGELGDEPMVFAGLYDVLSLEGRADALAPEGQAGDDIGGSPGRDGPGTSPASRPACLHSYTILTTSSSPRLSWLHDRMPVILRTRAEQKAWLETSGPYDGDDLVWHEVPAAMGKTTFQGPACRREVKKGLSVMELLVRGGGSDGPPRGGDSPFTEGLESPPLPRRLPGDSGGGGGGVGAPSLTGAGSAAAEGEVPRAKREEATEAAAPGAKREEADEGVGDEPPGGTGRRHHGDPSPSDSPDPTTRPPTRPLESRGWWAPALTSAWIPEPRPPGSSRPATYHRAPPVEQPAQGWALERVPAGGPRKRPCLRPPPRLADLGVEPAHLLGEPAASAEPHHPPGDPARAIATAGRAVAPPLRSGRRSQHRPSAHPRQASILTFVRKRGDG